MNNISPSSDEVLIAIRRIIRAIDQHSRVIMKLVGLTGPQLVVLQEVSKREEVSVGELSKSVSLANATVTGIIERLEKRDFVIRKRCFSDRRKVFVYITEKGKAILDSAPPLLQESFLDQFNKLQDWEQSMITGSLQRVVYMMDAKQIQVAPILTTGLIDEKNE